MQQTSRNKEQELAMQAMYGFLIDESINQPIDVVATIENLTNEPYKDSSIFIKEILITALKNQDKIIDHISNYLKNWKFSRLNSCIQAILILAVTNYLYLNEDKGVSIDVAVKLAKKYGDDDKDYKFVNAVLDNCLNDKCKQ